MALAAILAISRRKKPQQKGAPALLHTPYAVQEALFPEPLPSGQIGKQIKQQAGYLPMYLLKRYRAVRGTRAALCRCLAQ